MKKQLTEKQLIVLYRGFYIFGDSACLKILYELDRYGEKNFTELRDELQINPATLTKKLKLLVECGIVSADRTHDHLRVFYSINNHQKTLKRFLDAFERLSGGL
jgi:DNA-binding HxlR family transcriptional regulator